MYKRQAKQYADWYRYYKLEPPTVDTISDASRTPEKLKKKRDWLRLLDTPEYSAAYEDYHVRLATFQSRFLSDTEQAALWGGERQMVSTADTLTLMLLFGSFLLQLLTFLKKR